MYNDWDIPLKVCILSTRSKLCQIIGVCCLVEAVAVFSLAAVLWSAVRGLLVLLVLLTTILRDFSD